jgi:lactate 2-monooxygenase
MCRAGSSSPRQCTAGMAHGVDGLIVSNHGGRQLDGAIAALDALPAVRGAVGDAVPVLFDSDLLRREGGRRQHRRIPGRGRSFL